MREEAGSSYWHIYRPIDYVLVRICGRFNFDCNFRLVALNKFGHFKDKHDMRDVGQVMLLNGKS